MKTLVLKEEIVFSNIFYLGFSQVLIFRVRSLANSEIELAEIIKKDLGY